MVAGSKRKKERDARRKQNLANASRAMSATKAGVTGAANPADVPRPPAPQGRNASPIGAGASPAPSPTAYRSPVQEPPPVALGGASVAPQIMADQVIRRPEDPHPAPGNPGYAAHSGVENPIVSPQAPAPAIVEHVVHEQNAPREVPLVDVTVILYSSGESARSLGPQLAALRAQTVRPSALWVHVDGDTGHDDKTLATLRTFRTGVRLGRYFRASLARNAPTRFVAILDEDTIPGTTWLENSLTELAQANPRGDLRFGGAVIASAGGLLMADDPTQARGVGPEFPTYEPMLVDFGRQGWVFETELALPFDSFSRLGGGALAFAFAMAAAAGAARVPTIVLNYGQDSSQWPSRQPAAVADPVDDVVAAYQHYRSIWQPSFIGSAPAPAPAPAAAPTPVVPPAAPQEPAAAAQPQPPAQPAAAAQPQPPAPAAPPPQPPVAAPPPPGAPPLLVPQAPQAAPPPAGAVAQALAAQGQGVPAAAPPTAQPGHGQKLVPPPDAKVTKGDGTTQVEWVLPPEEQTPDNPNERVLSAEEQTPDSGQSERVLAKHEETPTAGQQERVLAPHERTKTEGQKEFVVGSSGPPSSQEPTTE